MPIRIRIKEPPPGIGDMPRICKAWVGCELDAELAPSKKEYVVSIQAGKQAIAGAEDAWAYQLLEMALDSYPERILYRSGDDFLFPVECCEVIDEPAPADTE